MNSSPRNPAAWMPDAASINRDNNFDLIRLLAALQVAVLHADRHLDAGLPHAVVRFLEQFPGVPIFFFVSGLLVTSSLARRPLASYVRSRARRILPALWLAFVLAVILLVSFGQIGPSELKAPAFWAWALGQITLFQIFSPDMFRDFGVGVVNGSLWTIPVEVGFYVFMPILAWVTAVTGPQAGQRTRMMVLLVLGALVSFAVYAATWPALGSEPLAVKMLSASPVAHMWQFALGALTYLYYRDVLAFAERLKGIPMGWALPLVIYAALGWWIAPVMSSDLFAGLAYPLLMFGVFTAALVAPSAAGILKGYDVSYGLYLYHMLVVNAAVALGLKGQWWAAGAAVLIAIVMAALSWKTLESPILRGGAKVTG